MSMGVNQRFCQASTSQKFPIVISEVQELYMELCRTTPRKFKIGNLRVGNMLVFRARAVKLRGCNITVT